MEVGGRANSCLAQPLAPDHSCVNPGSVRRMKGKSDMVTVRRKSRLALKTGQTGQRHHLNWGQRASEWFRENRQIPIPESKANNVAPTNIHRAFAVRPSKRPFGTLGGRACELGLCQ